MWYRMDVDAEDGCDVYPRICVGGGVLTECTLQYVA